MKKIIYSILVIGVFASCEDVVDLDLQEGPKRLVVDGEITDGPGPYQVQLSRTASATDNVEVPTVDDALIYITSSVGESDTLMHLGGGLYETQNIQGEIGRSYVLHIETIEGGIYMSSEELLEEVMELDSLYSWSNEDLVFGPPSEDTLERYIVVDYTEPEGTDYFQWVFYRNDSLQLDEVGQILIEDDLFYTANAKAIERPFFQADYKVGDKATLEIRSLSASHYFFLNELITQLSNTGSPFDTPPAPITGNITRDDDPEEQVLGFFGASAIYSESLIFD